MWRKEEDVEERGRCGGKRRMRRKEEDVEERGGCGGKRRSGIVFVVAFFELSRSKLVVNSVAIKVASFFNMEHGKSKCVCGEMRQGGGGNRGGREGGIEGPAWEKCENSRRQKEPEHHLYWIADSLTLGPRRYKQGATER